MPVDDPGLWYLTDVYGSAAHREQLEQLLAAVFAWKAAEHGRDVALVAGGMRVPVRTEAARWASADEDAPLGASQAGTDGVARADRPVARVVLLPEVLVVLLPAEAKLLHPARIGASSPALHLDPLARGGGPRSARARHGDGVRCESTSRARTDG